jgi:hypothetical protein
MNAGMELRSATTLSSAATVASASMLYATTSASDSRVYSSTTCRILIVRPVAEPIGRRGRHAEPLSLAPLRRHA